MTDKEKLDAVRAEIHRLVDVRGYDREMANDLFTFIDSLPNEPVSEGLEEEIDNYVKRNGYDGLDSREEVEYIANHFAKWQKEQMMTKSIEAVVSQVPCSNEIILYNPSSVDKYYLPQEMNKHGLNKGDKVKLVIIKED